VLARIYLEIAKIKGFCGERISVQLGMLLACSSYKAIFLSYKQAGPVFLTGANSTWKSSPKRIIRKMKEELLCEAFCACWQAG